jgi:hypothetical protein
LPVYSFANNSKSGNSRKTINYEFRHMSCRSFVVSNFPLYLRLIKILDNIGSTVYFLGDYNETSTLTVGCILKTSPRPGKVLFFASKCPYLKKDAMPFEILDISLQPSS